MFEQVTRPFARPGLLVTGRIIPSRNRKSVLPVVVIWGAAGEAPTPIEDAAPTNGFSIVVKSCDITNTESARQTNDVRVENKDDPDQFLKVRQIKQIEFKKPGKEATPEDGVAYSIQEAMKEFSAKMDQIGVDVSGIPDKCKSIYKLNWPPLAPVSEGP